MFKTGYYYSAGCFHVFYIRRKLSARAWGKDVVPMEEVKEVQDEISPASNPNKWLVWVFMKGPSCIRFSDVILSSGVEN